MNRYFTILLIILFSVAAFAANPKVDAIFAKYDGKQGFTTVNVTKDMFSMFMQMDNEQSGGESIKKALSRIDHLKILNYTADSMQNISKTVYAELQSSIPMSEYAELMVINDGGTQVKMLVKKKDDMITDFIMLVGESKEVVLINISGLLNLEELREISKSIDIKGIERLGDGVKD